MTAPELKPCPFCGADAELLGGPMSQDCYEVWCKSKQVRHHLRGTLDRDITVQRWNRRADLAAVPAQVKVKPLVWSEVDGDEYAEVCGLVYILYEPSACDETNGWYVLEETTNTAIEADGSIEAAKAAAQADYESRILAAIEPQPDPRDAVIARLVEALENRLHDQECPCNACSPMLAALASAKVVQHG